MIRCTLSHHIRKYYVLYVIKQRRKEKDIKTNLRTDLLFRFIFLFFFSRFYRRAAMIKCIDVKEKNSR